MKTDLSFSTSTLGMKRYSENVSVHSLLIVLDRRCFVNKFITFDSLKHVLFFQVDIPVDWSTCSIFVHWFFVSPNSSKNNSAHRGCYHFFEDYAQKYYQFECIHVLISSSVHCLFYFISKRFTFWDSSLCLDSPCVGSNREHVWLSLGQL